MKLQIRLSLKTGWLDKVAAEAGRDCDLKTPLQHDLPPAGTLRITDLGYFDTGVFGRFAKQGAYWLSPLMVGTNVYDRGGQPLALLDWLRRQGSVVDQPILLGAAQRVPCRMIAWRVPAEVANRRRQKIRKHARRKGRTPSAERLARCDWAIMVTNVPCTLLSIDEVRVLYRARWQVELLFKRWKSLGWVAEKSHDSVTRQMVQLWARLLAAVVQQWLHGGIWGRCQVSLHKAWNLVQSFALSIALALARHARRGQLRSVLKQLFRVTTATIRQNKRKKASTFEMLRDCSRLPYALT